MKRLTYQGTLFDPGTPEGQARRRPSGQIAIAISAEMIAAAVSGRVRCERVIVEAIHGAVPDARKVSIDLGTVRWTDSCTGRRLSFATPPNVRDALLAFAAGEVPHPFAFTLPPPRARSSGPQSKRERSL
jgi:hypothetical protein